MQMLEKHLTNNQNRCATSDLAVSADQNQGNTDRFSWEKIEATKRILVVLPDKGKDVELRAYTEYLSSLFNGQASCFSELSGKLGKHFNEEVRHCDLVLSGLPRQAELDRVLFGSQARRSAGRARASLLVAESPRWPIRKILLVLRVQSQEELAVEWAGQITHLSGAELTIQPIVTAQPLTFNSVSRLHAGIDSLLTPGTYFGEQLRSFLDQLKRWGVNGTLRVRQGDPLWQIRAETEEGNYDLIIVGVEQHGRFQQLVFNRLLESLMSFVDQPILISGARQVSRRNLNQARSEQGAK